MHHRPPEAIKGRVHSDFTSKGKKIDELWGNDGTGVPRWPPAQRPLRRLVQQREGAGPAVLRASEQLAVD